MATREISITHIAIPAYLKALGEGSHYCGWFQGWIDIEKEQGNLVAMWTTGKTMHQLLFHPAIAVEYTPSGYGMVCKSAVNMHAVDDPKEQEYWYKWMNRRIISALNVQRRREKRKAFYMKLKSLWH